MLKINTTNKFKKDLEKLKRQGKNLSKLKIYDELYNQLRITKKITYRK